MRITTIKRDKKILRLRIQGKTYDAIGKEVNLTRTRVWQICIGKEPEKLKLCKKHNKRYKEKCPLCGIDSNYSKLLENNGFMRKEIERLKKAGSNEEDVRKRKILSVKLRDDFGYSFIRIGQLLNKHYSTIIHYYNKFKEEKNYGRRN